MLYSYLREHPEICMANTKEVHFFDNEEYFKNVVSPDYSLYHAFFTPQPGHKVLGEATPIYMYWNDSPKRIWQYNTKMKIIVILRNPIDRAYSHWNMERSRGMENLSFWDALLNEQARCRKALPFQHRVYSYVDRGHYLEQLRKLWIYFPKERVMVVKNEDLRYRPHDTLNRIAEYLCIDPKPFAQLGPRYVHSREYLNEISKQEREFLLHIFYFEIRALEQALNQDFSEWLD